MRCLDPPHGHTKNLCQWSGHQAVSGTCHALQCGSDMCRGQQALCSAGLLCVAQCVHTRCTCLCSKTGSIDAAHNMQIRDLDFSPCQENVLVSGMALQGDVVSTPQDLRPPCQVFCHVYIGPSQIGMNYLLLT